MRCPPERVRVRVKVGICQASRALVAKTKERKKRLWGYYILTLTLTPTPTPTLTLTLTLTQVLNLSKLDAFHGFATDFITGIAHYESLVDAPRADEFPLDDYWQVTSSTETARPS